MHKLTLAATVLFFVGCGDQKKTAAPASPAEKLDACALVTKDEIAAALGRSDFSNGKRKDDGATCFFSSGQGSVTVSTAPATKEGFEKDKATFASGDKVEEAPGIGDEAYFAGPVLYVRAGERLLTVRLNQTSREQMAVLARTLVGKLR